MEASSIVSRFNVGLKWTGRGGEDRDTTPRCRQATRELRRHERSKHPVTAQFLLGMLYDADKGVAPDQTLAGGGTLIPGAG